MTQFTRSICGQGFEQKSRLERHLTTSHPPQAPSAADVKKVLSGIQYQVKARFSAVCFPKGLYCRSRSL
jgi:hypothetical protein